MDNLSAIRDLNSYFWGHLQMMLNFSEIVPIEMCMIAIQGIMKESCSLCDNIFLDIRVWEGGYRLPGCGRGDTASQDKNFSEIWVLKLRVLDAL